MNLLNKLNKVKILNRLKKVKKSKENIEVKEKDYKKNLKALKKKLIIRLLTGILGTTVILLFLFIILSIRSINSILEINFLENLERSRDQRKSAIEKYYSTLNQEMQRDIQKRTSIDIENQNYQDLGVEEVALFNSEYQVIYQSSSRDLLPIKKEIKSLRFNNPFYIQKITIDNDKSYQNLYYKIFKQDGKGYILYYKINNKVLNKILSESNFKADILNDEFYVVASNRSLDATEYTVNDISKKMLDGRVGTDLFKDSFYSYTYIDLDENSIYLNVYENIDIYREPLIRYKTKIYLLWFISILITLSVVLFIKLSVESYSQGISRMSIEKEEEKKYKFLKTELINIFDELDDVEDSLDKLHSFTKDLDTIKRRIINQNSYLLNKIKDDEELLKRIDLDEELKEKVKKKF